MNDRRWSRRVVALTGAVALHAAILAGLLSSREEAPPDAAPMTVVLVDIQPRAPAPKRPADQPSPLQVQAARSAPPDAPSASLPAPASLPDAPSDSVDSAGDHERFARALRSGSVGCANPRLLTASERELCNSEQAYEARMAAFIPSPIKPAMRAYYDQVAIAKAPDKPPTRVNAKSADVRGAKGHLPGVGCFIPLGAGKRKVPGPANSLKLGPLPCYVVPPAGSLSKDVDIHHPDDLPVQTP